MCLQFTSTYQMTLSIKFIIDDYPKSWIAHMRPIAAMAEKQTGRGDKVSVSDWLLLLLLLLSVRLCVCVRWVWIKTRLYPIYFRFVQFPVQLPIFVCTHTHQLGVTTIETHAARHMHEHNNASHSSNNLLIANLYSLPCTLAATTKIDHSDFEAA